MTRVLRKPYVSLDGVPVEQSDLEREAQRMCREHWNVEFTGAIEVKRRKWRRSRGQFLFSRKDKTYHVVRMCADMNGTRLYSDILRTLLHELVHWRLWSQGLPASDTDYEFIAECLRVGASLSDAIYAQDAYKRYEKRERGAE